LIYLFDNIIFWLICSGVRVYNIVFLVGLILVHVLAKKKRFWVMPMGMGCRGFGRWHGLLEWISSSGAVVVG
jgi:hypothetical protein